MNASEKSLVCGRCKVLSELIQEEGGRDTVRCLSCGRQADLDVATRLALEHVVSQGVDEFNVSVARSLRGSKDVQYVTGPSESRSAPGFIFL